MRAVVLLVLSLAICSVSPVFASANIMDVDEDSALKPLDGSGVVIAVADTCLLYTSPSPRDLSTSRMPSSA